jgi:cardiolipin synthase A/B
LTALTRAEATSDSALAERAFARAAGSMPIDGNAVRLLQDAAENYPAWLAAIQGAQHRILFENYIVDDDSVGREFAEALAARARAGVDVRIVYDWLGSYRARSLWPLLTSAGAKVQAFNRPRLDSPLGWVTRDHRKTLVADGDVAFVSGLCVSQKWLGDPERDMEPWRDTGIEIRGPAVAEIAQAFAAVWHSCTGELLPEDPADSKDARPDAGDVRLRVVAGAPSAAGTYRLDLVIASLARKRLWISDAYFVGTSAYVQALAAAARDGVDVRLLVPNGSDIPLLRPLSRSGYRTLLEAGIRIFEWNGPMLHAKTAVADGRWARVGSTNLNVASWLGNYELDVVVEDEPFAALMDQMYLEDLGNATEVVPDRRGRLRMPARGGAPVPAAGSGGRAAAGLLRLGSTVGAAMSNHRVLEPIEARIMLVAAGLLLIGGVVAALFPRLLAYPLAALALWLSGALLYRGVALHLGRGAPDGHEDRATPDSD